MKIHHFVNACRLKNNFLTDVLKCREWTFSDKDSAGFMKINVKLLVIFFKTS